MTLTESGGSGVRPDNRELKSAVHRLLLADPLPPGAIDRLTLRERIDGLLADQAPVMATTCREALGEELVREVDGLGPIEPLLADDSVTEIMLNGGGSAFVERGGRLEPIDLGLDAAAVCRIAERVIAPLGLRLDRSSPIVDARLADGSRLHAVIPPLSPDGPCITIRRFVARQLSTGDFGLHCEAASALDAYVRGGWNLVMAGGTSSGKTTLLNVLSAHVPAHERIVTIEQTAELELRQPHVVRLEARPPNAEGVGAVDVRDLVRTALRMRPDRIVVGEVRGEEALDMLAALNTGHDGSLSTVHANSALDALTRLETLSMMADSGLPLAAVRLQLGAAVDAIVFVRRDARGRRRVEEIAEVVASRDVLRVRPLFCRSEGRLDRRARPTRRPRRAVAADAAEWVL